MAINSEVSSTEDPRTLTAHNLLDNTLYQIVGGHHDGDIVFVPGSSRTLVQLSGETLSVWSGPRDKWPEKYVEFEGSVTLTNSIK